MQITKGKIQSAQKICIYGPEGIGKSTFASQFPNPLFIDVEGSTKHLDVERLPKPTSWTKLMQEIEYVKKNTGICKTLVIDTADWSEHLCSRHVCAKAQKESIEDFGYGKGYMYLAENFGKLLNLLEELIETGINIVFTAHAQMRKFEQPDEMGAYDRWEMKLQKKTAPLLKEWADMVLFANYKTYVINVDSQGVQKGKNKVQGGKRVMYTSHHPCWDAKNRHNLETELDFNYAKIAHCIVSGNPSHGSPKSEEVPKNREQIKTKPEKDFEDVPKALTDLMESDGIFLREVQEAVESKGYYPKGTPFKNYAQDFVSGVLIAAWPQVVKIVKEIRENDDLPF